MNKFVLTTHEKVRFMLDETEYKAFLNALRDDAKFVMIQSSVVPLQIIPSVVPFDVWYSNELDKLALSGKRLCRLCLSVMLIEDVCVCWPERGKDEERLPFRLKEIAPALHKKLMDGVKMFPKLTPQQIQDEKLKHELLK